MPKSAEGGQVCERNQAGASDSAVRAPEELGRPRILQEVVFIETVEGVLVDGLGRPVYIRGPLAQTILPQLIRLMDGTRTEAQLAACFPGIPADQITQAISILGKWGLIDADRLLEPPLGSTCDTFAFLKRSLAGTRGYCCISDACVRLQGTHVVIVTSDDSSSGAELIRVLLERTGVSVRIEGLHTFEFDDVPKGAVLASLVTGDPQWFVRLEQGRARGDLSWFHAAFDEGGQFFDVGPLFSPGNGCCYKCFSAVHGELSGRETLQHASAATRAAWTSHVAMEVITLLALPELTFGAREFRRYRVSDWDSHLLKYPRLPGCKLCRPDPLTETKHPRAFVTDTALVFEEYVGLESRAFLNRSRTEVPKQDNAILIADHKTLPTCKQIPLPRTTISSDLRVLDALREGSSDGQFSIEQLAAVLALTAGIREINNGHSRRWPATAGNLGSVELFVAAQNIDGIEPAVYFYQAREHQLAHLRTFPAESTRDFIRRVLGLQDCPLPDALVIFSGAFHRLAPKYGSFGYRLINLDAGACISQLHFTARALNLWSRTAMRWADDLIERELNLATPGELCTSVVEVSRRARKSRKVFSFRERPKPQFECFPSWKNGHELQGLGTQELMELVASESRQREAELQFRPRETADQITRSDNNSVDMHFPAPAKDSHLLMAVLEQRRSTRSFHSSSVPLTQLGTALYYANRTDVDEWPDEHKARVRLTFLVLAKRVTGLDSGVYEYKPDAAGLSRISPALSEENTSKLFVQTEFVDAAFVVWIAGNLQQACARHGAYGERQLLLRAGSAGHRIWMCALGFGLCGSLVAGLVPGAARERLALDGYQRASLFAVAIGQRLHGAGTSD